MPKPAGNPSAAKRKPVRRAKKVVDPLSHRGRSAAALARRRGTVCKRCSQQHVQADGVTPSCNGHKRRARPYQPCRRAPSPGAAVCVDHGASTGHIKANAAIRRGFAEGEGKVAALLRECDLPEQHPIDGLLEVVRHSGAMMRLLGHLTGQLDTDPGEIKLSFPKDKSGDAVRYTVNDNGIFGYNHSGDQAPHVLMLLYNVWADRYARACKLALDANIDERMVRNAENTSNIVMRAVVTSLNAAGLQPEQAALFRSTLATELRKLLGPLETGERTAIGGAQ